VTAQLLRAPCRTAVPWKNGGGLTREIAAAPPGATLDDFRWRVSTAEVTASGPFSRFADVDRTLCVLAGELLLEFPDARGVALTPGSEPFGFAGDVAVRGTPRGGPVTDLNVMTRRGRCGARVSRCLDCQGTVLALDEATTLLFALGTLELSVAGHDYRLEYADALCVRGVAACSVLSAAAFYVIGIRDIDSDT
jgi:environmental stress-induced protein Ves